MDDEPSDKKTHFLSNYFSGIDDVEQLEEFSKVEVVDLLLQCLKITKTTLEQLQAINIRNAECEACDRLRKQMREQNEEMQYRSLKLQQYEGIIELLNLDNDRLKKQRSEDAVSKNRMQELEALERTLTEELRVSTSRLEFARLDAQNELKKAEKELLRERQEVTRLKSIISQMKNKQKKLQAQTRQLREQNIERQSQIRRLGKQKQGLEGKIQQLQYALYSEADFCNKSVSLKGEGKVIFESPFEYDDEFYRQIEHKWDIKSINNIEQSELSRGQEQREQQIEGSLEDFPDIRIRRRNTFKEEKLQPKELAPSTLNPSRVSRIAERSPSNRIDQHRSTGNSPSSIRPRPCARKQSTGYMSKSTMFKGEDTQTESIIRSSKVTPFKEISSSKHVVNSNKQQQEQCVSLKSSHILSSFEGPKLPLAISPDDNQQLAQELQEQNNELQHEYNKIVQYAQMLECRLQQYEQILQEQTEQQDKQLGLYPQVRAYEPERTQRVSPRPEAGLRYRAINSDRVMYPSYESDPMNMTSLTPFISHSNIVQESNLQQCEPQLPEPSETSIKVLGQHYLPQPQVDFTSRTNANEQGWPTQLHLDLAGITHGHHRGISSALSALNGRPEGRLGIESWVVQVQEGGSRRSLGMAGGVCEWAVRGTVRADWSVQTEVLALLEFGVQVEPAVGEDKCTQTRDIEGVEECIQTMELSLLEKSMQTMDTSGVERQIQTDREILGVSNQYGIKIGHTQQVNIVQVKHEWDKNEANQEQEVSQFHQQQKQQSQYESFVTIEQLQQTQTQQMQPQNPTVQIISPQACSQHQPQQQNQPGLDQVVYNPIQQQQPTQQQIQLGYDQIEPKPCTQQKQVQQQQQLPAQATQNSIQQIDVEGYIKLVTRKPITLHKQHHLHYDQFKQAHGWDFSKYYLLEVVRSEGDQVIDDKLIVWKNGIISLQMATHLVLKMSNGPTKLIADAHMQILGNSEIIITGSTLATHKNRKRYFSGNMGAHEWTIRAVTVYSQ